MLGPAKHSQRANLKYPGIAETDTLSNYEIILCRIRLLFLYGIQSGAAGFDTGKGEKLSNSLARVAWVLLSFSPFPMLNPTAPPC